MNGTASILVPDEIPGLVWAYRFDGGGQATPDDKSLRVAPLHFALAEGLIVSGRAHPLRSVEALRQRLDRGERLASTGHVLESIVEQFVVSVGVTNAGLRDRLDRLEDRVLDDVVSDERQELTLLRRRALRLHRPLTALQRVLRQFEQRHHSKGEHALLAVATRLSQRIDDLDADVLAIEKRAGLLHDTVAAELSEQTNRHLFLLSMITSLLLPPTLVVGIFGMNTGGLPLSANPAGFAIAIVLCILSSALAWFALRRIGVLR